MSKKKRRKVPSVNLDLAKKNVKNRQKPTEFSDEAFSFDFRDNRWLKGVQVEKFTNKLRNSEEYSRYITKIFGVIIPEIQEKSQNISDLNSSGFKCHSIEQGEESYKTILKVMKEIYGEEFQNSIDNDQDVYQLGVNGGIRIITLRNKKTNIIKPLFIDYYHLAYPSVKHNQDDYLSKKICPIEQYL